VEIDRNTKLREGKLNMEYDMHTALISMLEDLQRQIDALEAEAKRHGCLVYELRITDGSFVVAPLLVAKTNALVALAQLAALENPTDG
jgi:hypothetical protein